ncbi:MAG: Smr/MutS family protein [Deltaproteobacteria bacterium]|nr:Smr/MutS family protein [Deltaproteobacteria bacterium]
MSTRLQVSPEHAHDLGWPRVLRAIADRTSTDPGRAAALELPFLELDAMRVTLARVDELQGLSARGSDLPLAGVYDIRAALDAARRGATLVPADLVAIAKTATAGALTRRHLQHHADVAPRLAELVAGLPDVGLLASELSATFDEAGQVRDDASPELQAARQRVVSLHRGIKERLDRFLARLDVREHLQDIFYTQREDRYVVPVVSSFQHQVPGIIHGMSNSGETVFVEPTELVETNNAIKLAESAVRVEIERVLRLRSEWVAAEADDLDLAARTLVDLDTLQARARLGNDLDAVVPTLSADGALRLVGARNPHLALKGTLVVPNDIALEAGESFLVVTGPNTGGKTVTLSTVGTFVLMLAAGLPIPASPFSVMPVFTAVHALIGDAQDIERDLSTFSGHLLAIQRVLDAAEPGTLVLLDEIIIGTEPTQGAALAIAVLESLASRGARGLVTTHYERLKTLPFEDPRFANASVGLDPETLAPTFVLATGRPGSSSPFDIALRLGFSPRLVDRARAVAGGHSGLAEALDRLRLAEEVARRAESAARAAEAALAAEQKRLEAERARLRRDARQEVEALYADARAEIRRLGAEIRERQQAFLQGPRDQAALADEQRRLQRSQDALRAALPAPEVEPEPARPAKLKDPTPHDAGDLDPTTLRPGLAVWVRPLNQPGELQEVRGDRATVAIGALKTTVPLSELGRLGGAKPKLEAARPRPAREPGAPAAPGGGMRGPSRELPDDDDRVPPPRTDDITADLRGARRDEVPELVEPVLDRAYREHVDAIWIIHGHGTGALREEVRELLARSLYVAGYRRGRRHEGGDGVTIAFLHKD